MERFPVSTPGESKEEFKKPKNPGWIRRKILAGGLAAASLVTGIGVTSGKSEAQPPKDEAKQSKLLKDNPQRQSESQEMKDAFRKYDAQREWMARVVQSDAYKKKAKKFEHLSAEELARRRDVMRKDIYLSHDPSPDYPGASGGYDLNTKEVFLNFGPVGNPTAGAKKYEDESAAIHEEEHAITDSSQKMSDYAYKLYENSFNATYADKLKLSEKMRTYIAQPTELDARRRELQYELERNGVWKYGQVFTDDDLEEALRLKNEGKLGGSAVEFLDFVKHEDIPLIMNTIAENQPIEGSKDESVNS